MGEAGKHTTDSVGRGITEVSGSLMFGHVILDNTHYHFIMEHFLKEVF